MAYLDQIDVASKPQYWSTAVYKYVPGRGYVFQLYTPLAYRKSFDQISYEMDHYPYRSGYATYTFYWDPLAGRWMRYGAGINKVAGDACVGAVERRNPLPPGRYWQDIFKGQATDWDNWAIENEKNGSLKIVKFEHFRADPLRSGEWLPMALQPENMGQIPERTWLLFDVLKPTPWPAVKLGFPTIVTSPAVQSSADVADNPPGPSPAEEVGEALKGAAMPIVYAGLGYLALKLWLDRR